MLRTYFISSISYQIFGQTYFTGNLNGKGRTRIANLQLKQGLQVLTVVQHGAVHNPFGIFGKMLEVGIMSGDNAKSFIPVESFQRCFGNGATYHRLRSGTKLINQQQGFSLTVTDKEFHVEQMRTIG